MGEVTESAEVVDSERKEGDIIGVEICNKDGSVNLGCATNELLADARVVRSMEGLIRESEYVITVTISCVPLTTKQRIRTREQCRMPNVPTLPAFVSSSYSFPNLTLCTM